MSRASRTFAANSRENATLDSERQLDHWQIRRSFLWSHVMASQSPLKAKPLRIPGESLDKEIDDLVRDSVMSYFIAATMLSGLAGFEWFGYLTHSPRRPILFSIVALIAIGVTAGRIIVVRKKVRSLRLGRDGERVVGQFLERLRGSGGQVFHDVPGKDFNLDHVVIHGHGIYAIETKTFSKPWPKANITIECDTLRVAGRIPDRNPIEQASAAARWLSSHLEELTGRKFPVRGVVVFPGWFVEQPSERGPVGLGAQDAAGHYRARIGNDDACGCGAGVGAVVAVCEGGGGEEIVTAVGHPAITAAAASNFAEQIGEQERLDAGNALPGFIIGNRQGRTRLECRGELNRIGGSKAVAGPQGGRLEQDGPRDRF